MYGMRGLRGTDVHVLVKHGDPNFFTVVHDRHKRYAVGMSTANRARHIQYSMDPLRPNLRLGVDLESPCVNVGPAVKRELDLDLGDVYVRPQATLTIDKRRPAQRTMQKELVDQLCYNVRLERMDARRFFWLPFVKEVGIVVPCEIRREDLERIEYACVVVMPASHYERDERRRAVRRLQRVWAVGSPDE